MKLSRLCFCLLAAVWAAKAAQAVDFTTLEGKVLLGYQGWFNCPGLIQRFVSWAKVIIQGLHWSQAHPP